MQKLFNIRIELELHSVTCPGVWLCPNGMVDMTISTLGYNLRTSTVPAKFPLFYHETFILEGSFKCNECILSLEDALSNEFIEMNLWQNSRRLAHFIGKLGILLYPKANTRKPNKMFDTDIIMRPSKCFPGIIGPKVEITSKISITSADEMTHQINADKIIALPFWNQTCKVHGTQVGLNVKRNQKAVCHSRDPEIISRNQRAVNRYPHSFQSLITNGCGDYHKESKVFKGKSMQTVMKSDPNKDTCNCNNCELNTTKLNAFYEPELSKYSTVQQMMSNGSWHTTLERRLEGGCGDCSEYNGHMLSPITEKSRCPSREKVLSSRNYFEEPMLDHNVRRCPICMEYRTYFNISDNRF